MAKTLFEYMDWLDERELTWPTPPALVPANATPFTKPLSGIRAVTWSVYGTLLHISEGELLIEHPQKMQMQIAMEKTIGEFNMWHSMYRQPGAPWKQMYDQYGKLVVDRQMSATGRKGDVPEVDLSAVWRELLARLGDKEYDYDISIYGDPDQFSDKVAYFFHANLQGVEAAPNALRTLLAVADVGRKQGLLANAQPFTLVQMLRLLREQGTLPPLSELFSLDCLALSFQEGVRKPSESLFRLCLERFGHADIAPDQILHVGSRLQDDLGIAKRLGMRTALYAADKTSLRATKKEMKDPLLKPDRLITDLSQVRDILSIG